MYIDFIEGDVLLDIGYWFFNKKPQKPQKQNRLPFPGLRICDGFVNFPICVHVNNFGHYLQLFFIFNGSVEAILNCILRSYN